MARKTKKGASGTSFHDTVLKCSVNDLIAIFGEPTREDNTGDDKVNFEWICETEEGDVFTIYDWKEYETPMGSYDWHIGGKSKQAVHAVTSTFKETSNA